MTKEYPNIKPKKTNNLIIWILLGLTILGGIGTIAYFATKNKNDNKNPNPSNIQYLPSQEQAETEINQIKTAKGIDDQQATIEFLTRYVPQISWWEINSLSELDEKINLVNNKTGFPPFKDVQEVSEFNQEVDKVFAYKIQIFFASVIPRKSNGVIDWKGLDFQNYCLTILKPILENAKFNSFFATQANYQELGRRIEQEINPQLTSSCSKFANISQVNELNELTNDYLNKIFKGYIYAECIHDELGQQLAITNHQKYSNQQTGNQSLNSGWNIALNEFAFKQENNSGNDYQNLVNDLQYIHDKFVNIEKRNEHEDPDLKNWLNGLSFGYWMLLEQDQKNGLPKIKQLQSELSSHSTDKEWITQTRNHIRKKHDWLFKKFRNQDEAKAYLDLPENKDRFKYINTIWQNQ